MNEEEFIINAIEILKEYPNITEEQAKAMANLTVILEKNNL